MKSIKPVQAILPASSPNTSGINPGSKLKSDFTDGRSPDNNGRSSSERLRKGSDGGTTNNHKPQQDAKLALQISGGIVEGADSIKKGGLAHWRANLEKLKPRGNLEDLVMGWQRHAQDADSIVKDLDHACKRCTHAILGGTRTVSLVRCFLEIVKAHKHKRSRIRDKVKSHAAVKDERQQRLRVGELMIAVIRGIYEEHGKKAHNLCAVFAGQ